MASASPLARVFAGLRWTLAGEVLLAASQFGMLVAMARMGSEAALGRYALGLAVTTPVFVLASLHLRPTFVVSSRNRFAYRDYVGLRLLGAPAAAAAAVAASALAGFDRQTLATVALVALMRLSEFVSDILHAAPARAEQLRPVGIGRGIRGLFVVGAVSTALALDVSPIGALGLGAAAGAVVTVAYDLPAARRHERVWPRFAWRSMRGLARLAAPVGIAASLLGLSTNVPAYAIERSAGVEELGRYSAVVSVLFISGVVNLAVGSAALPRLSRLYAHDLHAFAHLLARMVAGVALLNALILAACMLAGPHYLRLAYGPAFVPLAPELVLAGVVAVGAGIANLLSQTVVATGRFRLQLGINSVTVLVALGFAGVWVPTNGLRGGLASLGATTAIRVLIYAVTISGLLQRTRRKSGGDQA